MTISLDESLIYVPRRKARHNVLSMNDRLAINALWRKNVPPAVLCRAFQIGRNTLYYQCLTGEAPSYKNGTTTAREINAKVDAMGLEKAYKKYVTQDMIARINAELAAKQK